MGDRVLASLYDDAPRPPASVSAMQVKRRGRLAAQRAEAARQHARLEEYRRLDLFADDFDLIVEEAKREIAGARRTEHDMVHDMDPRKPPLNRPGSMIGQLPPIITAKCQCGFPHQLHRRSLLRVLKTGALRIFSTGQGLSRSLPH